MHKGVNEQWSLAARFSDKTSSCPVCLESVQGQGLEWFFFGGSRGLADTSALFTHVSLGGSAAAAPSARVLLRHPLAMVISLSIGVSFSCCLPLRCKHWAKINLALARESSNRH